MPFHRLSQAVCLVLFCVLLFWVAWPYGERFSTSLLADKEWLPAETFLWLDPLTGVSTALAGRTPNVALFWAALALAGALVVPRWFCSHACPLGTLFDAFHWLIGRRLRWTKTARRGPWVHARYYVLAAVLVAAVCGVMVSGYVAAIPVLTRGSAFLLGPAQLAIQKHPGMVRPMGWTYWLGGVLFLLVLATALLGRRFWCRTLCPSGALLSLAGLLRLRERRVTEACVECRRCISACAFDAVRADFTTRPLDCAFCPDCAAACPVDAIEFGRRQRPPATATDEPPVSRRAALGATVLGAAAAATLRLTDRNQSQGLIRPPGAVAEERFLRLCIRCGECIKACPGPVLHPAGLEVGLDALWTPVAVPSWAGCHQDCNFCGQVCPTGAIRPLPIDEKRKVHMGLAAVNTKTCLPHAGEQDCQLCSDECRAAGYNAITMRVIQLEVGDVPDGAMSALELEEASRILAPFVDAEACVGCGLCEYRCRAVWAKQHGKLKTSAIVVVAQNADRPT